MVYRTLFKAAAIRATKTFFQTILGVWTAGTLITEIDWKITLLAASSAAVYSIITSIVAGLPEVDDTKIYHRNKDDIDIDADNEKTR